jgi:hypothetical protein
MTLWSSLIAAVMTSTPCAQETNDKLSVFYVGNWLLDNAMPPMQDELADGAGKTWSAGVTSGRRFTPYMNLYYFKHGWPYNDTPIWTTEGVKKLKPAFEGGKWDAMVVQAFGWFGLHCDRKRAGLWIDDKLQNNLGTEDFGDVECISQLFDAYLTHHPEGALYVFEGLPELPVKTNEDGSVVLHDLGAGPEPAPDKQGFDFVKHWETVAYDPDQGEEGRSHSTRDYTRRLMAELRERFPDQGKACKLRLVPTGEVYCAMEKAIRNGDIPGLEGVTAFYSDTLHQRTGLPRYVLAATLYATLFRDKPHSLDWNVYSDPEAYQRVAQGRNHFYVHVPDRGELLPMTPETVAKVNDVIWRVVSQQPLRD